MLQENLTGDVPAKLEEALASPVDDLLRQERVVLGALELLTTLAEEAKFLGFGVPGRLLRTRGVRVAYDRDRLIASPGVNAAYASKDLVRFALDRKRREIVEEPDLGTLAFDQRRLLLGARSLSPRRRGLGLAGGTPNRDLPGQVRRPSLAVELEVVRLEKPPFEDEVGP